ncbi:MAG: hypothetical protein CAF45_016125 [Nitrospira sp. CG24E]|nr:MAG: hypothetical protein CAF45_016125 [Nitrospira sp. CG24E]
MKLVVTIDTEEDQWGRYAVDGHTLNNISQIARLQELFDEFAVIPTYLITYPVATDKTSVSSFSEILQSGRCEIGMHCHPWNTPPYGEAMTERNSMLCNLSAELQKEKLTQLHGAIVESFGIAPVSFRAGRWGYGKHAAASLHALGYKVDTSVLPFVDWSSQYGPNFSDADPAPYRFHYDDILSVRSSGPMLEVPATIGFAGLTSSSFEKANRVHHLLTRPPYNLLRAAGVLHRCGVLQKIWLSPENSTGDEMITLARSMAQKGAQVLNLFFHSPTLQPGLTPFVRNESDKREFMERIRMFLRFAVDAGFESIALGSAPSVVCRPS